MDHLQELASRIVDEGWLVPSVWTEQLHDGAAVYARWVPLWKEPKLMEAMQTLGIGPADREKITALADKLAKDRVPAAVKEEAFRSLHPRYGMPHTPLERWAYGLLHAEEEPAELPDWLAEDILNWQEGLEQKLQVADYRVAFVLLSPDTADGNWLLVPGLQAEDDASLFVSAAEVWRTSGMHPLFQGRQFPFASERLAEGLAAAAEHFGCLHRHAIGQAACELTEAEAFEFIDSASGELERCGLAAIVPEWWEDAAPLELAVQFQPLAEQQTQADIQEGGGDGIGFNTLLAFRKELLLGGAPISEDEWRQLTDGEREAVFHGGRWLRLRSRERTQGARFFREEPEGQMTVAEALRTVLATGGGNGKANQDSLPVARWRGGDRLAQLVAGLRGVKGSQLLEVPATLQGELRDYQERGFTWLARMRELGLGACLADDMGLGKTVQWIAYALYMTERHKKGLRKRPLLLLCPTSVLGNWQRELERFAPSLAVYFHYGPDRLKGDAFVREAERCDIVLTSYSTALRDRKELAGMQWDAVTLDEAQYVKNSGAQLTRFIRTLPSRHRIAMTGTPVENRLSDLWSIFEFINPGFLGSERSFRKAFGDGLEGTASPAAAERLHQLIQPFVLRRLKTDESVIRDLPDKIEHTSYCGLTERQAELYTLALERMTDQLRRAEGMKRRGVILSTITKLKQICNSPEQALRERTLRPGSSGKLLRLEELLKESLDDDGRCLIFTQYATMAQLLHHYLSSLLDCEVGVMTGQTPRKDRETLVERFQTAQDGPKVLVLSLKTGGFGLNLTRANRLIHYDRWWNPAAERQATDRAHRIGQTRIVEVWKLVTKGTLEEAIEKLLESKRQMAEDVVGTGERWLTEYSDEQLHELLALRKQVILSEKI